MNACMHAWMNEMKWHKMKWKSHEWMKGWMDGWMNEWLDGWMNEWINDWTKKWIEIINETNKRMKDQKHERMTEMKWSTEKRNEMLNEWMKEWTKWNEMRMEWNENDMKMKWYELTWTWDKCMNQWDLPTLSYKKSRRPQCLTIFMWNRALPTVVCTCCRPHLPKVLQASELFTIFMWNRALCRPHLPKDVRTPQSFTYCYLKSSSRLSLVHFLSTTFADRGPHKQKQRPYFGDHGSHFTRKNAGFRSRESFQPWIHAFPTSYTSQLLDEDEDGD